MDIQLFIVIIIGIFAGVILARGMYRFITKRDASSYCGGCKGCDIAKQNSDLKL